MDTIVNSLVFDLEQSYGEYYSNGNSFFNWFLGGDIEQFNNLLPDKKNLTDDIKKNVIYSWRFNRI